METRHPNIDTVDFLSQTCSLCHVLVVWWKMIKNIMVTDKEERSNRSDQKGTVLATSTKTRHYVPSHDRNMLLSPLGNVMIEHTKHKVLSRDYQKFWER